MKAKEVRDKYHNVGIAINALRKKAFNEFMDKEEENEQEYIRYMAIQRVDKTIEDELLPYNADSLQKSRSRSKTNLYRGTGSNHEHSRQMGSRNQQPNSKSTP